jgi:hypothetical protein
VAVPGMSILLGGAAAATIIVRSVARYTRNRRGCRLGAGGGRTSHDVQAISASRTSRPCGLWLVT